VDGWGSKKQDSKTRTPKKKTVAEKKKESFTP
jgi:hypothetical protein